MACSEAIFVEFYDRPGGVDLPSSASSTPELERYSVARNSGVVTERWLDLMPEVVTVPDVAVGHQGLKPAHLGRDD